MADKRIRIPKDKAELVKALKEGSDSNGPFQTYADVVAYAAALGANHEKRISFDEASSNPEPIPQEHFVSRKYEAVINLLSVACTGEPKVLDIQDISEENRIRIFEEYASGGLDIIEKKLSGTVDYLDQILLLLRTF